MRIAAGILATLVFLASVPLCTATAEVGEKRNGEIRIAATEGYTVRDGLELVGVTLDENMEPTSLDLNEGAAVSWVFNVEEAGEYSFSLEYAGLPGTSNDIEINALVNGNGGAQELTGAVLKRVWQNAGEPFADKAGNQIRPRQEEATVFTVTTLRNALSAEDNVYSLKPGENVIEIEVTREHLELAALIFKPVGKVAGYSEYAAANADKANASNKEFHLIEGESAVYKSNASLYPITDRSSADTSPSHYSLTLLNSVGGANWSYPQQWIEWKVKIDEADLYKIKLRVRQNTVQGQNSCRRLYIDGEIPFEEFNSVIIPYNAGWREYTLGGEESPYLVYLDAGEHTIRMENTVGTMSEVLTETDRLVRELNSLYRNVMSYIGSSPDADRDYKLDQLIPDLKDRLATLADDLGKAKSDLLETTGEIGEGYAQFQDLERQLRQFLEHISKLPRQFDQLRTNIRALSEWLLTAQKQPLIIDWISLSGTDSDVKSSKLGFFGRLWYNICAFFATFTNDYSSMSGSDDVKERITVWLGTVGRDQANALRGIINSYFTPESGIGVDLKLVDANSLIPAVATGNGPDVSLFIPSKSVMDYGFRGALLDLREFDDYEQSLDVFWPEALTPFSYGGKSYALPDSYSYSLLFYRRDILEELNLKVPETWQDVFTLLPVLNNNYMTFGMPSLTVDSVEMFVTMLYQKGGAAYDDAGTKTEFASAEGIETFVQLTNFYTKYGVPQTIDQLTYFRTGEAPLVIAPYTFCNSLAAGAPEIDGLWGATLLPGTADADGEICRTAMGTSTGTVIFKNTKHADASWEFLKWWTQADTQYEFGIEVETTLGAAGRIATATTEAMKRLPWDKDVMTAISSQLELSRGLPEVPGGYMSTRYLPTAMRLVVNNNLYPRDALITYSSLIDEEITTKRQEFHFE